MFNDANLVSWRDYEGVEGFGSASQGDVDNLNKALTAGQGINPPGSVTAGDGFALRVESLDKTLKNTTFKMNNIRFFKSIPKSAAYNTVEEFNQVQDYGENSDSVWIDEGDLPSEDDSKYERKFSIVKYMGTTRRVSHVMSMVKPAHGNVIAQETVHGTMHLLRSIERALFFGRSDLSALQWDGYEKLITDNSPAANIIDLRGKPMSEDYLIDASLTISDAPNFGTATHFHCNPKVKADLVKTFFPKERYDLFQKTSSGMVGLDIKGFTSPSGDVLFEPNVFITDGGAPIGAVGDAAKRPASPTVGSATTPVEATSKFEADDAGDYFYKAVAVNRYGRSAAIDVVSGPTAVTVAAGDKVTFALTPGSGPDVAWYEIYRTKKDGASGTERLILKVPNGAGAGAQTIDDINAYLPYTTSAFMFQQNSENMSFKQLAPMVKIPLATIDSSIRWMQLIYGVPQLFTPGKNVLFTNVGRSANFVGQP
jgi:plastocyanin